MFPVNCFVMFKNGTTMLIDIAAPFKLMFGTLNISKIPPASATITYKMLPMLLSIGPKMLAYLLAQSASSKSDWLSFSKSDFASSSWQNTLTTFSPFIISSAKPSSFPKDVCCLKKYFAEPPPIFLTITVISATPEITITVIGTLRYIIITKSVVMLVADIKSWGRLCDIICRSVSISFVYRLIMSPWSFRSKNLIGRYCILPNIFTLSFLSVP